jgi:E3 ubiquitin-protein ligase ZNF598
MADAVFMEPQSPSAPGRAPGRGQRSQRGAGRGRGRGRGAIENGQQSNQSSAAPDPSYGRPPGGSFGARLTETALKTTQGDPKAPTSDPQDGEATADDVEVCFICASTIVHTSIAPCNHQTCHICALRMRALYKTRACAHCRVRPLAPSPSPAREPESNTT